MIYLVIYAIVLCFLLAILANKLGSLESKERNIWIFSLLIWPVTIPLGVIIVLFSIKENTPK